VEGEHGVPGPPSEPAISIPPWWRCRGGHEGPGEPGVPAIGPGLRTALSNRFRLVQTEELGPDRLELYERT